MTIGVAEFLNDPVVISYAERDSEDVISFTAYLRYVVHRQSTGTFTPMVMDAVLSFFVPSTNPPVGYTATVDETSLGLVVDSVLDPFINGLFVDASSEFLIELLKGPESGFDRLSLRQAILDEIEETNTFWESKSGVPPVTKQGQKVLVYDASENALGSMLSPVNVLNYIMGRVTLLSGAPSYQAEIQRGYGEIVS